MTRPKKRDVVKVARPAFFAGKKWLKTVCTAVADFPAADIR
jgi:hypothetical protein